MPCGLWMCVFSVNTNFWAMSTRVPPLPSSPHPILHSCFSSLPSCFSSLTYGLRTVIGPESVS